LIIAGGRGTRFWPESRAGRPKPLFSIDGKTSLLDDTIARTRPLIPSERIFVLVSADQAAAFRRPLKSKIPTHNLIVEPEGRGTAVAITYGAAIITQRLGDDTVIAVMPADHYIAPAAGFRRTIAQAIALAAKNRVLVDRVVAEKSGIVLGVRARFRWHDIGSWEGLWEAFRGRGSNVLSGNAIALDADGVLARARDRLVVLFGVSDLVAIDTGDAILIAPRSKSQEVRRVIDELRRRGFTRYL
jgi:mannose-1-phosphate guanylyltransferase